ncbi:MAG: hypothetical protein WCI75_14265 [candidate division NC10 bacterium]
MDKTLGRIALACALAFCVPGMHSAPPDASGGGPAISESEKANQLMFVQQMLRTPLQSLSQRQINRFLYRVAPSALPADVQQTYFQKRDAIMGAGLHRSFQAEEEPRPKRAPKSEGRENSAKALLAAGYEEIDSGEAAWLSRQTKCTQAQLEEHATLKVVVEMGRDKKKALRYFLHSKDPFFAAVANYRAGHKEIGGTRLFGSKVQSFCGKK